MPVSPAGSQNVCHPLCLWWCALLKILKRLKRLKKSTWGGTGEGRAIREAKVCVVVVICRVRRGRPNAHKPITTAHGNQQHVVAKVNPKSTTQPQFPPLLGRLPPLGLVLPWPTAVAAVGRGDTCCQLGDMGDVCNAHVRRWLRRCLADNRTTLAHIDPRELMSATAADKNCDRR